MDQIALFDLDNTLCDWDKSMERDMRRVLPESMQDDITRWMNEDRRVRPEWVENLMSVIRTQVNWWKNLDPLYPGMQLLHSAIDMGWSVNILTKGPATKPRASAIPPAAMTGVLTASVAVGTLMKEVISSIPGRPAASKPRIVTASAPIRCAV